MINVATLLEMALVSAVTLTPIVVAARLLAGWTDDLGSILQLPAMGWPKGVQEEEPKPWRFGTTAAPIPAPGPSPKVSGRTGTSVSCGPGWTRLRSQSAGKAGGADARIGTSPGNRSGRIGPRHRRIACRGRTSGHGQE